MSVTLAINIASKGLFAHEFSQASDERFCFSATQSSVSLEDRTLLGEQEVKFGDEYNSSLYFSRAVQTAKGLLGKAPRGTEVMVFKYAFKGPATAEYYSAQKPKKSSKA